MIKIIELKIRIFGLKLDLSIKYDKKDKIKTPINNSQNAEILPSDEETEEIFTDEELNTFISEQARKFEEELRTSNALYDIPNNSDNNVLYDVPHYSDIPPRHNIQDDVEIITDSFEKEIEDIYVGRR